MKEFKFKKPFFGSNYYPEAWDEEEIDKDLNQMCELGLNCVRIAEFAWQTMEPQDGVYDFSLFKKVVRKCREKGISVMLGTPTATPPRWLEEKYPEILITTVDGIHLEHTARRNVCPNSEIYRFYVARFVEEMAKAFQDDDNIMGWQIDNEVEPENIGGRGCCCPVCESKFREYLRNEYDNDVTKLNKAWGNYVWGSQYENFEQFNKPNSALWHHPSYSYFWGKFQNDSQQQLIKLQYDIIRKYTDKPIGTDSMPVFNLDYDEMTRNLDVMQINQYYRFEEYPGILFWYDLIRSIKNTPFWLTETSSCWNGGVIAEYTRPKNFNKMNVWLAYLNGAELVNYWLWRSHYGGQELMHGSVVSSCGRPLHIATEVKELSNELEKASSVLENTRVVKGDIAIHTSFTSYEMFRFQPLVPDFNYRLTMMNDVYQPLRSKNLPLDVITPSTDISEYKIVITPFMLNLDESGLSDRIFEYVKNGGTWIVGPMSDIRTPSAAKYVDRAMGYIEKETGIRLEYTLATGAKNKIKFAGEQAGEVLDYMYDAYVLGDKAFSVADWQGDYIDGYSAICRTKYGKGEIIVLGALPEKDSWAKFISSVAEEKNIHPITTSDNSVAISIRRGGGKELFSALEMLNKEAWFTMPYDSVDILNGREYFKGELVKLEPHAILISQKK